jgi:hypothetical protein
MAPPRPCAGRRIGATRHHMESRVRNAWPCWSRIVAVNQNGVETLPGRRRAMRGLVCRLDCPCGPQFIGREYQGNGANFFSRISRFMPCGSVQRVTYPCEHADLIDITSFCDSVFGQTGLVRSDKEVPWFSQRFSTLSPKGQLQPS